MAYKSFTEAKFISVFLRNVKCDGCEIIIQIEKCLSNLLILTEKCEKYHSINTKRNLPPKIFPKIWQTDQDY